VKLVLVGLAWAFLHHLIAGLASSCSDLDVGVDKSGCAHQRSSPFSRSACADPAGGFEDLRSVSDGRRHPTPQGSVHKRIVVGAHYGVGGLPCCSG